MNNVKKTFMLTVVCVVLIAVLTALPSVAASVDTERTAKLTLQYRYDGRYFSGLEIRTYRIADVSSDGKYSLAGDFAEYPVELCDVESQAEWRNIAFTIAAYAVADGITPGFSGVTDNTGTVKYDVSPGMYLTMSVKYTEEDGGTTVFETFLTAVPYPDGNGNYNYDVVAYPKCSKFIPGDADTQYRVVKQWKDSTDWQNRPESIAVDIYRDGAHYATEYLNPSNNWSFGWTAPDDGADWCAVERDVPDGYTVSIVEKGNTFVITNAYGYGDENAPQTGNVFVMWPYVLVMIFAGGVLTSLSVFIRRNEK